MRCRSTPGTEPQDLFNSIYHERAIGKQGSMLKTEESMDASLEDVKRRGLTSITEESYEDLVHYFKYASSAYSLICPRPNGKHLVMTLSNPLTDIQGFVARDDQRQEIIISLRGSVSLTDILLDIQVALVPFIAPGVKLPESAEVHAGFLFAWESIAFQVLLVVEKQIEEHPGYTIVTTGHSLGGAMALFAAVNLQQKFKDIPVRTYSYGSPRSGNKSFADYVNATFGENAHRVVHGDDGVPTMIPRLLGYHHHGKYFLTSPFHKVHRRTGIEYWQYTHPASGDTTAKCDPEGEDPCCSASVPSQGVTLAHTNYFGIMATTPFCL